MSLKRFSFESLVPEADFGAATPSLSLAGGTHAEISPPPSPAAPTFSEEELEAVRRQAYEEGFMAGKKEGKREADHALMELQQHNQEVCQHILQQVLPLQRAQEASRAALQPELGRLVQACAQKLAVEALRREPLADIEAMVSECLGLLIGQPEITVFVHPRLQSALSQTMGGKIRIVGAPDMNPVDCRVQWQNGEAVRDIDAIWQQIEDTVARYFAPSPIPTVATDLPEADQPDIVTSEGEDHGG